MRTIKFRAWDKERRQWSYFTLLELQRGEAVRIWYHHEKWCQFTGLLDSKGKEIYEGDILKHVNRSKITKKEYWFPIYKVEYELFGFTLNHIGGGKSNGSWWLPLTNWGEMKIIGNIYENHDLIPTSPDVHATKQSDKETR